MKKAGEAYICKLRITKYQNAVYLCKTLLSIRPGSQFNRALGQRVMGNELDKYIVPLLQFVHFCSLDNPSKREHTNNEFRLTGNLVLRKVR